MDDRGGTTDALPTEAAPPLPPGWLSRWPAATFILPFAVFMVLGSFEPTPPRDVIQRDSVSTTSDPLAAVEGPDAEASLPDADVVVVEADVEEEGWLPDIPYRHYPVLYSAKIGLTVLAMLLVWPGYRTFPWRVTRLAVVTGIVGGVLWIVLCQLHIGAKILKPLGLGSVVEMGRRSAFNPLEQLADNPAWAYGFLAIRLFGLAVVVPIIEEFFLRGFLMRFVVHDKWHLVPFGTVTRASLIAGTVAPMMMHTGELFAAAIWFSLISWLMVRTRTIWDCVLAHAITNAMLGAYVLWTDEWWMM